MPYIFLNLSRFPNSIFLLREKMLGKGKSVGHSQSGTCSGAKTLKRCKNNGEADNIVLIDVDNDSLNNVIIIDVPQSLKDKLRGSSILRNENKCKFQTVICIDEDENSGDDHHGMEGTDDFCSDTSSSGRFYHASDHTWKSVDAAGEDCQFVPRNLSPRNLSKSRRTYSGRASCRNYYGLVPESDLDSSEDGFSDCEYMEDSFGKLREQWEKANMKKRYDIHNAESVRVDQATTSAFCGDTQENVEVENVNDQHTEAQACSSSSNASNEEESTSPFVQSGVQNSGGIFSSPKVTPDLGLKSNLETLLADIKHNNCVRGESHSASCSSRCPYEFKYGCSSSVDNQGVRNRGFQAATWKTLFEKPPLGKSGFRQEGDCCINHVKPVIEESSFFTVPCNGVELNTGTKELSADFMSNRLQIKKDGTLSAVDDAMNTVEDCIINEREKLKETDEYKRAAEEEWASRQRELQLQAEEAQKLRRMRKRERLENMRLLDMEKRQRQRVEEMREIQKKDEENLNLKEQLRAEVRKELNRLEVTCYDMVSLLRGLGIHVDGGFQPQPHEVRAAYKRALLSFHPDRSSGSDVRQLVEAEEKFKLISRMKEKFSVTS
ncbi:hypothetical protein NMG60_11036203 [Bertholletia excelsa]